MPFLFLIAVAVFILALVFAVLVALASYLLLAGLLLLPFLLVRRRKAPATPMPATSVHVATPATARQDHTPPPPPPLPAAAHDAPPPTPNLDPEVFGVGSWQPSPSDTGHVALAQRWNALLASYLSSWVADITALDAADAPAHAYRHALQRLEYQSSQWLLHRERLEISADDGPRHPARIYLKTGELWELMTALYLEALQNPERDDQEAARRWAARIAPHTADGTPTPAYL